MPAWFHNASNMKQVLAHDKHVWGKLLFAITAESPECTLATGATPAEAIEFLAQRADAVGDRISGLRISDAGIVDWSSISPWVLKLQDRQTIVLQHRFTGAEA